MTEPTVRQLVEQVREGLPPRGMTSIPVEPTKAAVANRYHAALSALQERVEAAQRRAEFYGGLADERSLLRCQLDDAEARAQRLGGALRETEDDLIALADWAHIDAAPAIRVIDPRVAVRLIKARLAANRAALSEGGTG